MLGGRGSAALGAIVGWQHERATVSIYQTFDLTDEAGIHDYIRASVLVDVRQAFEMLGSVKPFGVALATMEGKHKLAHPLPVVTSVDGTQTTKLVKKMLRKLVGGTQAVAAIYVVQGQDELKVHLEHKTFGDQVWAARISNGKLLLFGMYTPGEDEQTRFMPQRYGN